MLEAASAATWLGIIVTAGGALAGAVRFSFWIYDEVQKRRKHSGFSVPTETLRPAAQPDGSCWWFLGKTSDGPTMHLSGHFFASNITQIPIRIPQVMLRHGFLGRKRTFGSVEIADRADERRRDYGMFDIPPNETREVRVDFWVYPPVFELDEAFAAQSITFIDQFGNRHSLRSIRFTARNPQHATKSDPEEYTYEISDPIAKEVVSVLKAELARYRICGRSSGGLGSVHIIYQGRVFTGVGNDSWTPDLPQNQAIAEDPDEATLKSDNLDALLTLYGQLQNEDERSRFRTALLSRLHEKRGYLAVSYFIVTVLWKVDELPSALKKARADLPAGESQVFGLSNVLMLLNGLLRYRHGEFPNEMLDEIERFVNGLSEHPFLIPSKIAAIRARRLISGASRKEAYSPLSQGTQGV